MRWRPRCPSVPGAVHPSRAALLKENVLLARSNVHQMPALDALEALDVQHKDGRAAHFYFNGVGQEELAWLHHRRNRGNLLLTRGAVLANGVDNQLHVSSKLPRFRR